MSKEKELATGLMVALENIPLGDQKKAVERFLANNDSIETIKGLYAIMIDPETFPSQFEDAYLAARQLQPFLKTEMLSKPSVVEAINPIYAIITESENSELVNYEKSLRLRELVSDLTFRMPTLGSRIAENLNIKGTELNAGVIPTLQQLADSVVADIGIRSDIKQWIQFRAEKPAALAGRAQGYAATPQDPYGNLKLTDRPLPPNPYGTLPLAPEGVAEAIAGINSDTTGATPFRSEQQVRTYNLQNRGSGEAQTADFPTPPTSNHGANAEGQDPQYPSSDMDHPSAHPHSDANGAKPFYGLRPKYPEPEETLPIAHIGNVVPPTVYKAVTKHPVTITQVPTPLTLEINDVTLPTDQEMREQAKRAVKITQAPVAQQIQFETPQTQPQRAVIKPAIQYGNLPADTTDDAAAPVTTATTNTTVTTNTTEDTTTNNSAVKAKHPLVLTNELSGFKSNQNNEINKVILGSLLANLGVKPDDIDLLISQAYVDGLKVTPQTAHLVRMRTMVEDIVAKSMKPLDGKTLTDAEKKELYNNINTSIKEKADNVIRKVGLKSIHHSGFIGENYSDINAINTDGMQRGNKLFEEGLKDPSSWKKTLIDSFSDDKSSEEYAELIRKKHVNLAVNKPEAFSFMGKLKLFGGLGGAGAAMYLIASFFPALLPLIAIGKLIMVFSAISVVIAGIGEVLKGFWELIKGLIKVVAGITKLAVGAVTLTIDLVKSPIVALMNRGREQENKIEYFNFTKKAMSAIDTGISTVLGDPKEPKTLYKPRDESKHLANRDGLKDKLEQISVGRMATSPAPTINPAPPALTQPAPTLATTQTTRPTPAFTAAPAPINTATMPEALTRTRADSAPAIPTASETARPRSDSAPAIMSTTPPNVGVPPVPTAVIPAPKPMSPLEKEVDTNVQKATEQMRKAEAALKQPGADQAALKAQIEQAKNIIQNQTKRLAPQEPPTNPMNTIANMANVTGTEMFNTGPIGGTNKIYDTVPADVTEVLQGAMSAQPAAASTKPPVPPVPGRGSNAERLSNRTNNAGSNGGISVT